MLRVAASAVGAVLLGLVLLFVVYGRSDGLVLEMDRHQPAFVSGLYATERDGETTFAWTSGRTVIRLAGLDRRVDWTCTMRMRGAREPHLPMPSVTLAYDAAGSRTVPLSNTYEDIAINIPARPERPGLTLTVDVAPTFVPGPGDPRELGAQVDWIRCAPAASPRPPAATLRAAAVATGSVALALGAAGASVAVLLSATGLVGAAVALLLSNGNGAFGPYPALLAWIVGTAATIVLGVAVAARLMPRRRPSGAALAAVAASSILGALKLAALTHPAKALVDAVFQAHRLQAVMAGNYFFTQPLPDGVQFPYAIGLYVTALPFAGLLTDHVLLLRTVVIAAEALAGGCLYLLLSRLFRAPAAAVLAVVLFQLVPIPYVVIGNANLTNAFAEAAALLAVVAFACAPERLRSPAGAAVLLLAAACTTLAFLSHVSTIVLLAATLGAVALALLAGGRPHRPLAFAIAAVVVVSGLVATGLYYRHFTDVYVRALDRVRATDATPADRGGPDVDDDRPAVLVRPLAWHERAGDAVRQTTEQVGLPLLLLLPAGAVAAARHPRSRGALVLVGWAMAWIACLFGGTMTRVDTQYQRYAAEFIGRVNLACYPVAVVLASLGAGYLWRLGIAGRLVAGVLTAGSVLIGTAAWRGWFGG